MDMAFNGRFALPYYGLLLESCYLTTAKKKEQLLDIPGFDGQVDLLKNWGEPTYAARTLTAYFTASSDVNGAIRRLVNDLEGRTVPIILPGYLLHYMSGTVHIAAAGAERNSQILITAVCDPWLYRMRQTEISVPASDVDVAHMWRNCGKKLVVPEITVEGADVTLTVNGETLTLAMGTHLRSELAISGGANLSLAAKGGAFTATYREAVLL